MVDSISIIKRILGPEIFEDDITADISMCTGAANPKLKCRMCAEICPAEAISIQRRKIDIEHASCTHCGACVAVCPTQALSSRWLTFKEILSRCIKSLSSTSKRPIIACSRILEALGEEPYDVDKIAEIPCLERIDEALILSLVASGASELRLVHADCTSCEIGCMGAVWTLVCEMSLRMLDCIGRTVEILDLQTLPPDALQIRGRSSSGDDLSRRDMFNLLRDDAKQVMGNVVDEVIESPQVERLTSLLGLDLSSSPLDAASRQKVCEWALGAMILGSQDLGAAGATGAAEVAGSAGTTGAAGAAEATEAVEAAETAGVTGPAEAAGTTGAAEGTGVARDTEGTEGTNLTNPAAEALSKMQGTNIYSRIYGTPTIDPNKCVNCFLCSAYCKSHAISKVSEEHVVKGFRIRPYLCVQCGACSDICRVDAILVEPRIDIETLLCERETVSSYDDWKRIRKSRAAKHTPKQAQKRSRET